VGSLADAIVLVQDFFERSAGQRQAVRKIQIQYSHPILEKTTNSRHQVHWANDSKTHIFVDSFFVSATFQNNANHACSRVSF
ncbi:MAG: hypothetical protein SV775_13010, partial [Thermodesulfobacteriota bacterium]|nr:hypothetical protein [Thermodesulfobacteriota bacterium]